MSAISHAKKLKKNHTSCQLSVVSCSQSGQFLLEVVIAVAILVMLATAFFNLIIASYQILGQSRAQVIARALANEKLELIHNLPYDSIGTSGGIPNGTLLQQEDVTKNGQTFTILTSIIYKDDPFDGLSPNDLLPTDYKIARVQVNWGGVFPHSQSMVLFSNISPKGLENTSGGGTLYILVFDSQAQPIPQANVNITAPSANPPVNLNLTTGNDGTLVIPGVPPCTSCFNLTVTKPNYSTDRTYTNSEIANPIRPPLTVLAGQLTQASFAIDQLAPVTFNSVSNQLSGYQPLANTNFHLTSNKSIGTDSQSQPIYKLDQDFTTNSNGQILLDLEWGTYQLTLDSSQHNLAGSYPFSPVTVTAANELAVKFIAVSPQAHTLLAQVQDASGSAIASASARLFDGNLYDEIILTGDTGTPDLGQSFFSPLGPNSYTLEVQHPNFETATTTIDVSGQTKETVILNPL